MWKWLDGKKTIIGSVALIVAAFLEQVIRGELQVTATWVPQAIAILQWFGMILGGVGLGHKVTKQTIIGG